MATRMSQSDLDLQEHLARIRQMMADGDARYAEAVEGQRNVMLQAMIAGAALFGAGATLAALFLS